MSQLLTREAIEQAGTQITKKGNTVVPAASTLGLASGSNGVVITFDSSNSAIAIGDTSNNAFLMLFTDSGDTAIIDSSANKLLAFTAVGSAVNYISLVNAAASSAPKFSAIGTDTNIDIELAPKGSGTLTLKGASIPSAGIDFTSGSSGSNSYVLRGPQDGSQSASTASITLPVFNTAPTTGHVLKVSSGTSGTAVATEWAAESGGGLTYNAVTSGTTQTAAAGNLYALTDSSRSGAFTVTLPSSGVSAGDEIQVVDAAGISGTSSTKITFTSSQNINGSSADFDLQADFGNVKFLVVSISGVPAYITI